jgi:tRNA A37 N6-isopentenylltransferase MiaA
MDKLQILFKLETCIEVMKTTENVYVRKQLELIANALVKDWNESDAYAQQIREILNVDETYNNLDNLRI